MSRAFNARRRRRGPHINITSLIDVMFLLLIFFMVSSTFREHLGIDISLPEAATSTDQDLKTHEISVTREGDLFLGQQKVDEAGLRKGIQDLLKNSPEAALVLRADEGADFGKVIRVVDLTRELGGSRLVIPTRLKQSADGPPGSGSVRSQ